MSAGMKAAGGAEPSILEAVGTVGEHQVQVVRLLRRGIVIDLDGERYLPEAATKEFARFVLLVFPVVVLLAFAIGYVVARWLG